MDERPTVLLVGPGGLGGATLDLLVRERWPGQIVVAGRDADRGSRRANVARLAAVRLGFDPDVRFEPMDVREIAGTATALARIRPAIVLSTASLQSWWLADLLPEEASAPLRRARFGAWLPVHFVLTKKLMEAVKAARTPAIVLTAPFPDVVNQVLGRLGLAPDAGIGNVDEIVPKIELLAARRLNARPDSIRVLLIGHHALEAAAFGRNRGDTVPPHYLRVEKDGLDVTPEVHAEELLLAPCPLSPGPSWHTLTAACAIRLMRALMSPEPSLRHVPGPHGLPGGYPVWASRDGISLAEVGGITLEEAVRLNEASHPFDGVERVEEDGTVVLEESSAEAMRQTLGYDCLRVQPCDMEERAWELLERFRQYASRHGADVDRLSRLVR
ncbi:MAG: hypothetical protein ACE148_09775 [Vicinamibacterales bacterium]